MLKQFGKICILAVLCVFAAACSGGGGFKESGDITVVTREDGSGTRGAFIELFGVEEKGENGEKKDKTTKEAVVATKTDVMLQNVSNDKQAIGYVSIGALNGEVKALKIDGTAATAENVKNGAYKVARPFNIAVKGEPSGVTKDFIDFILSADGQAVVSASYISVDENAAPFAGTNPSGKIGVVGSSSVAPVMEKLKEAYVKINPSATVEILESNSTSGITAAIDGTCDIGMASRDLKDSELEKLSSIAIAIDGIAVIVNKDNPRDGLTSANIKDVFTGAATKWSDLK